MYPPKENTFSNVASTYPEPAPRRLARETARIILAAACNQDSIGLERNRVLLLSFLFLKSSLRHTAMYWIL